MAKSGGTSRQGRIRMTPQRMAILEYLEGNTSHPSAADVFKAVSERFPTISFATVYNTLEMLRKKGHLHELSMDPGKKRFDPHPEPHHHIICLSCRSIFDVGTRFDLELPAEDRHGFEITGNHIDFYGLCLPCRQKAEKNQKPKST